MGGGFLQFTPIIFWAVITLFFNENLVDVLPESHPLALKKSLSLNELQGNAQHISNGICFKGSCYISLQTAWL